MMNPPSRSEVAEIIRRLLAGALTRDAASEWACRWLLDGFDVKDDVVWEALQLVGAADLISTDGPYLYTEKDFSGMLMELGCESAE